MTYFKVASFTNVPYYRRKSMIMEVMNSKIIEDDESHLFSFILDSIKFEFIIK